MKLRNECKGRRGPSLRALLLPWLIALSLGGLGACGIFDFSELVWTCAPGLNGAVLEAGQPITVRFSQELDHDSAQQAFSLVQGGRNVGGDFSWDGLTMRFQAIPALERGKHYYLKLSGAVLGVSGKRFAVEASVDFYAETAAGLPSLLSWSPEEGDPAGVESNLVLDFDHAMDPLSFRDHFQLSPASAYELAWENGDRRVRVSPKDAWQVGAAYSWQLGEGCKDSQGVALGRPARHCFVVRADAAILGVEQAAVMRPSGLAADGQVWLELSQDLSTLVPGDALGFSFDRDLDPESLSGAFQISPPVKGHLVLYAPRQVLWVADAAWTPQADYVIAWSTSLKDQNGNALREPWRQAFKLALPWLGLSQVEIDQGTGVGAQSVSAFNDPQSGLVCPPRDPEGSLRFILHFDQDLVVEDRAQFTSLVRVERYFPQSAAVGSPDLINIAFPAPDQVAIIWEGFTTGSAAGALVPAFPHWYRLVLPGGPGGIRLASGSYLEKDTWLLFATN